MNKKRVLVCLVMCFVFLFNVAAVPATVNSDDYCGVTTEPTMPALPETSRMSVNQTSTLEVRSQWLNEVVAVQEAAYGQKVIEITEDENYITLMFEAKDIIVTDSDTSEPIYSDIVIESVAYLKPEARNKVLLSKGTTRALEAKLITYWGWSGWHEYAEKSCLKGVAVNIFMEFVPEVSRSVDFVVSTALGAFFDTLDDAATVIGESRAKYYYRNKAGAVYNNGYWQPTAYVGERRCFGWSWGGYRLPGGEPVDNEAGPCPVANETSNPTNYDSRQIKPHYWDDAWIIQKAIDTFYSGGYWDAYGVAAMVEGE